MKLITKIEMKKCKKVYNRIFSINWEGKQMKRQINKFVVFIMAMVILVGFRNIARAEKYLENNKNSVVQVVMTYTTEDGKRFILQSGSGVVINSNTVLTNYHLVHMSSKNLKKAKKYVLNNSEATEFSGKEGIRIAIVKKDDVLIYGEIAQESQEKDFAILALEEETDRPSVVLGNSDVTVMAENVVAIGYPSIKPFSNKGNKLFGISDVNLIGGIVSEAGSDSVKIGGTISNGNSGGALVDAENGEMIGLLIYNAEDEKKECFKAIPINQIKYPYLEGTTYSDNSVATTEEATTEATTEEQVDKTLLSESIEKALKLDQSIYTSESYLILVSCLQQAQKVQYNEQATQAEVDDAQRLLQQNIDHLELVKETNWVFIIGIVIAVIVIIATIIIIAIALYKMNKQKKQKNQFVVLPADETPNFNQKIMDSEVSQQTAVSQENMNQETTLLNMAGLNTNEDNMATTILNTAPPQVKAYLIRTKTGEKKQINSVEFTVGKDETRVNYFINNNEAISRCHMKIIKRGINYFVMDLGSTNHTYLNGELLPENQEQPIKNGDSIKLADEEFILEIR